MTHEDYDQVPGWPQVALAVRFDPAPMHGPFFPATERRLECREANAKWLLVPGNRDKARKAKAAYKRKIRAATEAILVGVMAVRTLTTHGAKP